jgi:hypothetical protein
MIREEAIDAIMKMLPAPTDGFAEAERRVVVGLIVDSFHRNGYVVVPYEGAGIKLMRGIPPAAPPRPHWKSSTAAERE